MTKKKKRFRRISAMVLAAVLAGSSFHVSGLQVTRAASDKTAKITAFTDLSDEIKNQELAIGSLESEINLPTTLTVTLELQAEVSNGEGQTTEPGTEGDPPTEGDGTNDTGTPEEPSTEGNGTNDTGTPEGPSTEGNGTNDTGTPEEPSTEGNGTGITDTPEGTPTEGNGTGNTGTPEGPSIEGNNTGTPEGPSIEGNNTGTPEGTPTEGNGTGITGTSEETSVEENGAESGTDTGVSSESVPTEGSVADATEGSSADTQPLAETAAVDVPGTESGQTDVPAQEAIPAQADLQASLIDAIFPAVTVHAAEAQAAQIQTAGTQTAGTQTASTQAAQTQTEGTQTAETVTKENITLEISQWKLADDSATFSSDESAAGSVYTYVPVLPSTVDLPDDNGGTQTYALTVGADVALPSITVTIDKQDENDVASVKTGNKVMYYDNVQNAFSAASAAGSGAEITLLKDISLWDCITVSGGQITLDLNGKTLSAANGGSSYNNQILLLENTQMTLRDSSSGQTGNITNTPGYGIYIRDGASLVMESGSVKGGYGSEYYSAKAGIYVNGSSLTVSGGKLEGGYGIEIKNGNVTVTDGTITGTQYALFVHSKADITLTGGTYTGKFSLSAVTFAQMLGDGMVYYSDGKYLTEDSELSAALAAGTVSIRSVPVKSVSGPSDLNLNYGYTSAGASLSVVVEKSADAVGEPSYQWYQVGTGENGEDKMLSDSEGGYSGSMSSTLTLPEGLRGGEKGMFYCVVDCSGYKVQSSTASVEVTECLHENLIDGTCQDCGRTFEASVTANDRRICYSTIEEAWSDAKQRGSAAAPAQLTLLKDTQVEETLAVEEGNAILLASAEREEGGTYTLSGNVNASNSGLINVAGGTLTLSGGTISNGSGGSNAVAVNGGTFIMTEGTVQAASKWNSAVCVYSGTAQIHGGTVSAEASGGANGVAVVSGSVIVSGGDIRGTGEGAGVYINGGNASAEIRGGSITGGKYGLSKQTGSVTLSGGSYYGEPYSIYYPNGRVRNLLADYCDYYRNGLKITDMLGNNASLGDGTVTVKLCNHDYGEWEDKEDGTHSSTCTICGYVETEEHKCDEWTDSKDGVTHTGTCTVCNASLKESHTRDENGTCTLCGANTTVAVSVTVGGETLYYGDIQEAWAAAKNRSSQGTSATVTLLADVTVSETLLVENGDSIILESGVSESGQYGISGSVYDSLIKVKGGSFTMNSGKLCNSEGSSSGIKVESGTVSLNGGEITENGSYRYGLWVSGGDVEIRDGFTIHSEYLGIEAMGGNIRIRGGTIIGEYIGIDAYFMSGGKLSISGGEISGGSQGVSIGNAVAEITGGKITGNDTGVYVDVNDDTALTISAGSIEGDRYGLHVQGYLYSNPVSLTGGVYTGGTASICTSVSYGLLEILFGGSPNEYQYYAVDSTGATLIEQTNLYGTALSAADGYGTVIVKHSEAETVSVSVAWGSMSFAYSSGAWNTETLTYGPGSWLPVDSQGQPDESSGRITVTNEGLVPVNVSYTFQKDDTAAELEQVSGKFTLDIGSGSGTDGTDTASGSGADGTDSSTSGTNGSFLLNEMWKSDNAQTISFLPDGAPQGTFASGTALGTITITIADASADS